jgi:amino acid permease
MVRKSSEKQWNRQNSILLHETIPLMFHVVLTSMSVGAFSSFTLTTKTISATGTPLRTLNKFYLKNIPI